MNPSGNMWDAEAASYSIMTLMEVNGTNKQLDAIPLDREDTVLDCGCGPGRVAIQLAKRVKRVICLDSSQGMLEKCRENCAAAGVTNVEFVLADWQEAEIGTTIPEVDVVIQSRGGGGPSTLEMLRKAARKYAVTIIWTDGAPNIPMSREKLFVDCYSQEDIEKYPELKPFKMRRPPAAGGPGAEKGGLFGGASIKPNALPMMPSQLREVLAAKGIELHVTTVEEGWDRQFRTREEAYTWLLPLSRHPELVDMAQFRKNVDRYLTETDDGYSFFLPTASDVAWFKTR